jgi:hypothetical protein
MANANRAKGLAPYEEPLRESPYVAGGTVYPGDIVRMNTSGQVIAASADTAPNCGVSAQYATSGQECKVWDHPDQKFVVQADAGGSVAIAQTNAGLNYQIVATAGSTQFKQSRQELDASSGASDSNLPLRMLAIQPAVDNAPGVNAKVVVVLNNKQLAAGTEGA